MHTKFLCIQYLFVYLYMSVTNVEVICKLMKLRICLQVPGDHIYFMQTMKLYAYIFVIP